MPRSLVDAARSQHGLLVGDQLAGAGLVGGVRQRFVDRGELVRVHDGVFKLASHPETFDQRCLAASLAVPDAAISGPTAARIYGLRKVSTDDIHLLAHHTITVGGVIGHRTNMLTPSDVQRRGLLCLLKPARLACDLSSFLSDADLESVIEQMLDRRMTDLGILRDVGRRFMVSGRNGAARFARVLDGRPAWRRPVDSDLELRLLRALAVAGLVCETQYQLVLDGGRAIHLDLACPSIRLGIEVDHTTWHGGRLEVQRDKARDRATMRVGWTVARVTDDDIDRGLPAVVGELVEIARQRGLTAA